MHRYTAIERRQAIQPTLDTLLGIVDYVLPIEADTVTRAKEIVLSDLTLSARDAIHVAATESHPGSASPPRVKQPASPMASCACAP